jgi:flagellar biosynthesis protein FlhF
MRLKLFRAPTIAAAMNQVRAAFGPDALILGTRHLSDGVEVTAALEPDGALQAAPDPARLAALRFHGIPDTLHPALDHGSLEQALASSLSFVALPLWGADPPLLFVGPPGAGKTLTTVRLATRLVMAGTPPMVITTDGQRAGATEQMAAFTRLLRINLVVANHPVTLARALTRRGGEPTLIDGPGTDPFDPAAAADLRALAGSANATMTLVLPAGLDPAEATDLARAYAAIGARLLVITRLDLARRVGGAVAAAAAVPLPLTEVGIGPDAAGGLTPLTPAFLAARIMQTGVHSHAARAA